MVAPTPFREFVTAHAGTLEDMFLVEVQEPHLLLPILAESPEEAATATGRFQAVGADDDVFSVLEGPGVEGLALLPISGGSGARVTLGRGADCDLVVRHPSLSKEHLYFRRMGNTWTVTDANSVNGVWVDGKLVPPEFNMRLKSGARILLGGAIPALFLAPADLYARVAQAAGSEPRA